MEERIADTGAQIAIARRCGFAPEGDRLEELARGSAERIDVLFSCLGLEIDAERVLSAAIKSGERRAVMASCGLLMAKLRTRIPVLIEQGEREAAEFEVLLARLGIELDR